MLLYLFTLLGLLVSMSLVREVRRVDGSTNRALAFAGFGWLFVLAAIRQDTGTDFQNYRDIWTFTPSFGEISIEYFIFGYLEPLFVVANVLLKVLGDQELLFYSFYAALTLYVAYRAISEYQLNQVYACFVYFCSFYLPYTFNAMRQSVAMSLFLLSLKFIVRKKTREVWLLGFIATGFHFSGVLIIVSYYYLRLLEKLRISTEKLFVFGAAASLGVGVSGLGGAIYFGIFSAKFETYAELFSEETSLFNVAIRSLLAFVLVRFGNRGEKDAFLDALLKLYLLGLFLYLSLLSFNVLGTRFNMFVRIVEVLLIPAVCARLSGVNRIAFFAGTTALLLISFFTVAVHPDYSYQTIFG